MKEKVKKISVIIPCYNVSAYIDRCMTSIVSQTMGMDSLEIICVDDASIDDTWEKLQSWEHRFPKDILLIRQEKNRRPGAARNLGCMYASADWIAFVDADDWLESDYFELLYVPTVRHGCDVAVCSFIRDASGPREESGRERKKGDYIVADTKERKKKLFRDETLGWGPWAKLLRKGLLMEYGIFFPEDLAYEDMYWLPLLYIYTEKIYVLEEQLYHYFVNPDSTTLCRNTSRHMDMLTIQVMKWEDYSKRGLFYEYQEELEQDVLNDAICMMTQLVLLYDKPPFSFFQMERGILKQYIPDHRYEHYRTGLDETPRLLLDILYSSLDESAFLQVIGNVKEHLVK